MTIELSADHARRARWHAHLLGGSALSPVEVVDRAVALQGQDLPAVLRAIAVRSRPGTTLDEVRAAFDTGELVRSWPMRGTLFATTPEHLAALLSLTGERIHRSTLLRRSQLGIPDATIDRARSTLHAALLQQPLRRSDALAALEAAGIATAGGVGYHLLMHLSVEGFMHWGPFDASGAEQVLVLTGPRASDEPEAALVGILRGVILARGPMTDADLAWWTKLPKGDVRRALARIDDLVEVSVDGTPAWVIGAPAEVPEPTGVTLVPGFDEWILGYADRTLVASPAAFDAIVPGGNGVFRPAVLVDGVVVGSWRFPAGQRTRAPEVQIVERVSATTRRAIDRALAAWPY